MVPGLCGRAGADAAVSYCPAQGRRAAAEISAGLSRQPHGHRRHGNFPTARRRPEALSGDLKQMGRDVHYVHTGEESKALTANPMAKVIISASGMATGGRVLHHLEHYAPDPKNAILFTGFQAGGTARGEHGVGRRGGEDAWCLRPGARQRAQSLDAVGPC